ncbi:MAG TPA: sigma-70 family RNA polymerase sigma factor [Steroidobacteraceae bacterium]
MDRQRLLSAARRLLSTRADAEDAVQDTYVRALSAFPDWLLPQPAWLHGVLRNIAIDRLRRKQLESRHANTVVPPDNSSEPAIEMRSECEAALRYLLSRVSLSEAAAILLRDVFEFEYEEIGRLAGKSAAASRQFLHRARTRLRRAGPLADVGELYVGWCWRAIEARDPALLMDMLQMTAAWGQPPATAVERPGGRSSSMLVQVSGRYAIALVLDGVVLCVVPLGSQATLVGESV